MINELKKQITALPDDASAAFEREEEKSKRGVLHFVQLSRLFGSQEFKTLAASHTALLTAAEECLNNVSVYDKRDEINFAKLKAAIVDGEK